LATPYEPRTQMVVGGLSHIVNSMMCTNTYRQKSEQLYSAADNLVRYRKPLKQREKLGPVSTKKCLNLGAVKRAVKKELKLR